MRHLFIMMLDFAQDNTKRFNKKYVQTTKHIVLINQTRYCRKSNLGHFDCEVRVASHLTNEAVTLTLFIKENKSKI